MVSWFEQGNIYSPVSINKPYMRKGYQLHPSYKARVANVLRDSVGVPKEHVQSMINDIMTDSVVNKGRTDMMAFLMLGSLIVAPEVAVINVLRKLPNSVKWDLAKRSRVIFEPLIEGKLQQKMQHYGSGVKRQPRNQSWQYQGAKYQPGTKTYTSKYVDTKTSTLRRTVGSVGQMASASRLPTKWQIQNLMYDLVDLYQPEYYIDQPYQPMGNDWFPRKQRRRY